MNHLGSALFTFLLCSERSGSNFVTSLVGAHPLVCAPSPSHLFRLFGTNSGKYGNLQNDPNWNILIDDVVLNFNCKLGVWQTGITADELRKGSHRRSAAELLRVIYEKEASAKGATRIFVKENNTHLFVPFLLTHFPGCRFVLMVRDPRDVAASWLTTDTIAGGVEKAVKTWMQDQAAFISLYYQMRDSGRMLLLHYEDLIEMPERMLEAVCGFLDIPYAESMLEFFRQPATVANAERIEAWANLTRPVMTDNAGKHKSVLTDSERRYVELACSALMSEVGYRSNIERDVLSEEETMRELAELRKQLRPGGYRIREEKEQEIRRRRLNAINIVLERNLS
jgi:hypothetical protein